MVLQGESIAIQEAHWALIEELLQLNAPVHQREKEFCGLESLIGRED